MRSKLQSCTSLCYFFLCYQYLNVPFESENVIVVFSLLQLLIGYENGTIVFWDLRSKRADLRAYYDEVSNFH